MAKEAEGGRVGGSEGSAMVRAGAGDGRLGLRPRRRAEEEAEKRKTKALINENNALGAECKAARPFFLFPLSVSPP